MDAESVVRAFNAFQNAWARYLETLDANELGSNPFVQATADGMTFAMNAHALLLASLMEGGAVLPVTAEDIIHAQEVSAARALAN